VDRRDLYASFLHATLIHSPWEALPHYVKPFLVPMLERLADKIGSFPYEKEKDREEAKQARTFLLNAISYLRGVASFDGVKFDRGLVAFRMDRSHFEDVPKLIWVAANVERNCRQARLDARRRRTDRSPLFREARAGLQQCAMQAMDLHVTLLSNAWMIPNAHLNRLDEALAQEKDLHAAIDALPAGLRKALEEAAAEDWVKLTAERLASVTPRKS
jgi:hypothetical protein